MDLVYFKDERLARVKMLHVLPTRSFHLLMRDMSMMQTSAIVSEPMG
jgi:hypothetical protein